MNVSLNTIMGKVLETVIVLVLVLLFFLITLVALNKMFPTGQSLVDLVRPGGGASSLAGNGHEQRKLRLNAGSGETDLGDRSGTTAVLTRLKNRVKSKRADQIAWQGASEGMVLYNRDAVQSLNKSAATLLFKEGNYLQMGENSLIVLRSLERDPFTRENRAVVVLMDGQLSGQITRTDREDYNLEVIAPAAVVRAPAGNSRVSQANFRMTVQPDQSSVVTVLEGTADITVDDRTVEVGTDEVVKIQPGQPLVYLRPPPGPPALSSPEDGETFPFRDIPPRVKFTWDGSEDATGYHFILAADRDFLQVVHEARFDGSGFAHGNLSAGDYYWRVSSVNRNGEGTFSPLRHFRLVQDLDPPELAVTLPDTAYGTDGHRLRGRTEPEARVFVGGVPVSVDDHGEFTHDLSLQQGFNVIVVEAVDKVGNVAYFSQVVNVEF